MYPDSKAASMVTMVAMVGNSVGKSAKKSVAKIWSTSWSLQTLLERLPLFDAAAAAKLCLPF